MEIVDIDGVKYVAEPIDSNEYYFASEQNSLPGVVKFEFANTDLMSIPVRRIYFKDSEGVIHSHRIDGGDDSFVPVEDLQDF